MSFFRRKRSLAEYDPSELDLEMLSELQASLLAKLTLVNRELAQRYRNLVDLSEEVRGVSDSRQTLASGADHLERFNELLQSELARIMGK